MGNEWVKVELYGSNNDGEQRRYTIADATAVSQGTVLALADPRTVTASTAATTTFAGIAAEDHNPNEGVTSISAWTDGVFLAVASGGITVGWSVAGCENNKAISGAIIAGSALNVGAGILGYALNTATTGQTAMVRLKM